VAFTAGDPVALAKGFAKWVGENAEFKFKLGIVDGKVLNVEEVKALATMPGKEEIFAKLLFLINAPAQRLATVINATGRDLAVVLNQGVEKEKFSAGPGSSTAGTPAASAEPAAAPTSEAVAPAPVSEAPAPAAEAPVPAAAASEVSAPAVESESAPATPASDAPAGGSDV